MGLSKEERRKRGLRTESRYLEGEKTYQWERRERSKWGGRRFNKQADPVVRKSKSGAKVEIEQRIEEEKKWGIKRGDPKRVK